MEAKRTPLIELLERVPRDAVLVVEHDQFSSSSHPVGRLCHEAAAALEAAREEVAALRKAVDRAWNEGFDFATKACGWQEGEDPATEGLYVARDSKDNVEVGMWYAKTTNSWPAEWTREFRDVDRDDIVAWMAIPDWRTKHGQ